MYLEATLRMIKGTGQPTGIVEDEDNAQGILNKLKELS